MDPVRWISPRISREKLNGVYAPASTGEPDAGLQLGSFRADDEYGERGRSERGGATRPRNEDGGRRRARRNAKGAAEWAAWTGLAGLAEARDGAARGITAQEGECGRSELDAGEPADYDSEIRFAEERAWNRGGNGPVVNVELNEVVRLGIRNRIPNSTWRVFGVGEGTERGQHWKVGGAEEGGIGIVRIGADVLAYGVAYPAKQAGLTSIWGGNCGGPHCPVLRRDTEESSECHGLSPLTKKRTVFKRSTRLIKRPQGKKLGVDVYKPAKTDLAVFAIPPLLKTHLAYTPSPLQAGTAALHKSLHASDATIMSGTFLQSRAGDSSLENVDQEAPVVVELLMKAQTRARIGYRTTGYCIRTEEYRLLLQVLFDLRQWAEDSFRLAGKCLPAIPSWGDDDDLEEYWSLNDFKILAVCFRVEGEHLLYLLDKYHDFIEKKHHDFNRDVSEAAKEFSRARSQSVAPPVPLTFRAPLPATPAHGTSDFETSDEQPRRPFTRDSSVRFGLFAKNNGLPKNNHRMSEILNPMANVFEAPFG
ncbi:hypothetical protein C8R44DRAFT_751628 [Mycena epipterygia]|nr:hypothetical protein C8R44DRAFT_751628 [Mycena epipterygia]